MHATNRSICAKACSTFILLTYLLFCPLQALSSQAKTVPPQEDIPYLPDPIEEYFDQQQVQLSHAVIDAATWFDSFFNDDRFLEEENRSTGRIIFNGGYDRRDGFQTKPRIRLRLHLPKINERLNLLIAAQDDTDFDLNEGVSENETRENTRDLSAALQYHLHQTKKWGFSISSGAGLDYLYGGLRYRTNYDYGSWQGRLVNHLRWYTDDGWDYRAQYDLERRVSEDLLFRSTLEGKWEEERNGLPHGLLFSLFQVLSEDQALQYEVGNYFQTRPSYQMTDLVFSLRYRQRFYRDWLVFEISPRVSFPEEYDRKFNPGIILKLEAQFGYAPLKNKLKRVFSF